jgi:hypothetical protein
MGKQCIMIADLLVSTWETCAAASQNKTVLHETAIYLPSSFDDNVYQFPASSSSSAFPFSSFFS